MGYATDTMQARILAQLKNGSASNMPEGTEGQVVSYDDAGVLVARDIVPGDVLPAIPAEGTFVLTAVDGALSWVEQAPPEV